MLRKDAEMKDLVNLGKRVYKDEMKVTEKDGKTIYEDEELIKDICNKTFGTIEKPRNPKIGNNIELFNEFLTLTIEEIAEPSVQEILGYLADFRQVPNGTIYAVELPKTTKPKWLYTAKGTSVDMVRLDGGVTKKIATPEEITYGAYYEITTFRADPVRAFREAVNRLAEAKLNKYFELVFNAFKSAISNSEIPDNNKAEGSNLGLSDFQKVENTMIRLAKGRPLFLADSALINHFANQVVQTQTLLLTNDVRDMLREDLVPSMISKTPCLAFPNTWIDEQNSKVRFDPSYGFMFPATTTKKPFAITEFGAVRQYSDFDDQTEQVDLKIVFSANIMLVNTREIGAIHDDTILV